MKCLKFAIERKINKPHVLNVTQCTNQRLTGVEITAGHHCGGEIFQSIFSQFG